MPGVSSLPLSCGARGYCPAQLSVVPSPCLDGYALFLLQTVQKANMITMSHGDTSSEAKYTKEEHGRISRNHLGEVKGDHEFLFLLARKK